MSCLNITGISSDCLTSMGGIQKAYIGERENVDSFTVTAGEVTALTMATGSIHEYSFQRDSSNFEEEMEMDPSTGITLWTQTVNLQFKRRDVSKRNSIQLLAAGQRDLFIIVIDNNGESHIFGLIEDFSQGVQLSGDTGGSGSAKSDMNGYELTFSNQFPAKHYSFDKTLISGLVA